MTKECYYTKRKEDWLGYMWYLPNLGKDTPACKCIMAVEQDKTIKMNELYHLHEDGVITLKEYNAIRALDNQTGEESDLKIIKKLAKNLDIKMVRK